MLLGYMFRALVDSGHPLESWILWQSRGALWGLSMNEVPHFLGPPLWLQVCTCVHWVPFDVPCSCSGFDGLLKVTLVVCMGVVWPQDRMCRHSTVIVDSFREVL